MAGGRLARRAFVTAAVLVCLLTPAAAAPATAQARRFQLEDLASLVRLSDPQVSPDGQSIVFLAARPNHDTNRWDTELRLLELPGGAQRVLVSGRSGLRTPRWSPTGDRIAFVADVDDHPQIHVLTRDGGEARALTRAPDGVRQFAWRPDGTAIAFLAGDTVPAPAERHNDAFEAGNDAYLTTRAPTPAHLWIVELTDGQPPEARRLTAGDWSAATSLATSPLSWSADGRTIAFVRFATPHSGDTDQSAVWLLDVGTGGLRALTGRREREWGPAFSPDGAWIAYTYPRDGDPANLDEIHVAPARGAVAARATGPARGGDRAVTRELDRHITEFTWLLDGLALCVLGTDGTRSALWIQPLSGRPRRVPLGDIAAVSDLAVGSRTGAGAGAGAGHVIAFVGVEPGRPAELYYLAAPSVAPRRVTNFHAEIAARALGRTEAVSWETHDGMRADGVLTVPPDFRPGVRYPLVLLIHGGPTASSTEEFSTRAQLLAAQGWLVFQPNYRGSDNRGNAFQRAIAASAAAGPGRDIMAGVAALARRGIVDTTRMAVTGWSYGGYLTAWLLGRYPDAWRAGVAGAAPMSLLDMYNLSDLNVMRRHAITASPWVGDRIATWLAESPIVHAWRIRAPTLILSNSGDVRVAATGSYALYHALRDNHVPVRFVVYPGSGHAPGDPVRQRDVNRRWIEWLTTHLR